MSNPQGQDLNLERQPGESEQEYQDRLQRTSDQGAEAPGSSENADTQGR